MFGVLCLEMYGVIFTELFDFLLIIMRLLNFVDIMSPPQPHKLSFTENLILGGIAAVLSKTAAAPLERIKLLVQNQVRTR